MMSRLFFPTLPFSYLIYSGFLLFHLLFRPVFLSSLLILYKFLLFFYPTIIFLWPFFFHCFFRVPIFYPSYFSFPSSSVLNFHYFKYSSSPSCFSFLHFCLFFLLSSLSSLPLFFYFVISSRQLFFFLFLLFFTVHFPSTNLLPSSHVSLKSPQCLAKSMLRPFKVPAATFLRESNWSWHGAPVRPSCPLLSARRLPTRLPRPSIANSFPAGKQISR